MEEDGKITAKFYVGKKYVIADLNLKPGQVLEIPRISYAQIES